MGDWRQGIGPPMGNFDQDQIEPNDVSNIPTPIWRAVVPMTLEKNASSNVPRVSVRC
jgi:hypothetical protein